VAPGRDDRGKRTQAIAGSLVKALAKLRERHDNMTVLQAMCLFHIAENPGITQRKLYEALGTSDSVASRTLALLSDAGENSLELVEMTPNPKDRREKFLTLSGTGQKLIAELLGHIPSGT
jgi:DNA-binding MarR family transcriptional regulator